MKKISISLGIALLLTIGLAYTFELRQERREDALRAELGDATMDGGYQYKNITSANASSTAGVQVRGGAGVLGHIIIGRPASTTNVRIYDGTTSTSTGTLIATIHATSTGGLYGVMDLPYEVAVAKGIILDVPAGFAGDFTVSHK